MPAPGDMLPGRPGAMPITEPAPACSAPRSSRRSPRASRPVFGMGCFWGAERMFWQLPGVFTTAVGYAGGSTPNPTYEETCSGRTGHTEAVLVAYDPARISSSRSCSRSSGRATTRPRACGRATTSAPSTARRSTGRRRPAAGRARLEATPTGSRSREPASARSRPSSAEAGPVLLRRGLPPAVPRQEPGRLLRHRRHRRELPDRDRRHRLRPPVRSGEPALPVASSE